MRNVVQVGAHDLEFSPAHFVKWFDMVFGKAPDETFEAGMKMLMECATPETMLGMWGISSACTIWVTRALCIT